MSNIIILDTGAEYIIANDNKHIDTAVKLYESMEVTIYQKKLDVLATKDEMQFIYDNIGRIIPSLFAHQIDIPKKIEEDVSMALTFYKSKTFWKNLEGNLALPSEQSYAPIPALLDLRLHPHPHPAPLQAEDLLPSKDKINERLYGSSILHADLFNIKKYILYNNIYGLSVVAQLECPGSFCAAFPEFIVVMNIDPCDNIDEPIKRHFDKVSYSSIEDIKSTCEAFKKLYGLGSTKNESEKDNVKRFIDTNFDISNDLDKKMKANEMYKELINHMCISYEKSSAFKKRVAGYLTELGLQKKRFSDAYYYYGIRKKEYAAIDISKVEEQRDKQRKEWFYSPGAPARPAEAIAALTNDKWNTSYNSTNY
jgi:hypothetical protein